jgi:hypothetical protein
MSPREELLKPFHAQAEATLNLTAKQAFRKIVNAKTASRSAGSHLIVIPSEQTIQTCTAIMNIKLWNQM